MWQDFLTNDGKIIHKCVHYFPVYDRHFSFYQNKSLTFLEIGVSRGGSLRMWQRYFGPLAKIIGIDIKTKCKELEGNGVFVRIGDQSDEAFLQSILDEFGPPDIVLDDGSHVMEHIAASFFFLYPKMPKNGVYMVEDLCTAYWPEFGGGVDKPDTFVNLSKRFIDQLNADHTRGALTPDFVTRQTFGIHFYDSMIAFEKGDVWRKEALQTGHASIPLKAKRLMDKMPPRFRFRRDSHEPGGVSC
jgi:hypothetical protein